MASIPSRDISGVCEGECKDLVQEAYESRQVCLESEPYSVEDSTPSMSWSDSRNEAPGFLGGHV